MSWIRFMVMESDSNELIEKVDARFGNLGDFDLIGVRSMSSTLQKSVFIFRSVGVRFIRFRLSICVLRAVRSRVMLVSTNCVIAWFIPFNELLFILLLLYVPDDSESTLSKI